METSSKEPELRRAFESVWADERDPAVLRRWERAWNQYDIPPGLFHPSLLDEDAVIVMAGYRDEAIVAGAIANRGATVAGLTNVFSAVGDLDAAWCGSVAAVAALVGDVPLLGYERGDDLEAARRYGFALLGPLRVWSSESDKLVPPLCARVSGSPELSDPVGSLEVGQHEDVKQLGAGSGPEGVQVLA